MNTFSLLFQVVIAFVAVNCQQQFMQPQFAAPCAGNIGQFDQQLLDSQSGSAASASASAASSSQNSMYSNNVVGQVGAPLPGMAYAPAGPQYGYAPVDNRAPNTQVSESFHSNKGEILIHRPAPIIVKRPPTKVLVNHPPIVVKPAPVVLHKPPPVIMRKVFVKQHPRPVKVEPVYVNVVKPPAEKYFVNEKAAQGAAAVGYNQFQQGPAYYQGPAQLQGAQFINGPVQYAAGPAQYAYQAQDSQSQAQAQASASADSSSSSQQQMALQSDQFSAPVQPQGCY